MESEFKAAEESPFPLPSTGFGEPPVSCTQSKSFHLTFKKLYKVFPSP